MMNRRFCVAVGALSAAAAIAAQAQTSNRASWLTDGGDSARTSWQRNETILSPASARDMKLLWKVKLDNAPRQLHNLFGPLIVPDVQTADGPREIVIVAGVSDNIYGIDVAKGTQIWKRHFDSTLEEPQGGFGSYALCPGGLTATPAVAPADTSGKYKGYAVSWDGRLRTLGPATGA